jgi:chromosome segregation ATPase
MRAIETHEIKAFRDNKNHWKIPEEELDRWANSKEQLSERAHQEAPTSPTPESSTAEIVDLQMKLTEAIAQSRTLEALLDRERQAVNDLKNDRDHWRSQAERLSNKKTKWWPW